MSQPRGAALMSDDTLLLLLLAAIAVTYLAVLLMPDSYGSADADPPSKWEI